MVSALFLGLLLGMQHALEADHLAAVASLATQARSRRGILRHGITWGIGHMLTLAVCAGAVIVSERTISTALAGWLEIAVGVMLVLFITLAPKGIVGLVQDYRKKKGVADG